jgi:hypothetical protein
MKVWASLLQVAGLCVFAVGVGVFHIALGLMAAGAGCVVFGLALERD